MLIMWLVGVDVVGGYSDIVVWVVVVYVCVGCRYFVDY